MRESLRTAAVAALGVLAVAFAAATLDSAVGSGVRRGGAPSGGGAGESGSGSAPAVPTAGPPGEPTVTVPPELLAALAAVVVVAALAYTYRHRRDVFGVLVGAIVVFGLVALLVELVPSQRIPVGSTAGGGGSGVELPLGGDGADGRPASPIALPILFGLLVALAAAVFAVVRSRGRSAEGTGADENEDESDAAAVGRAAGRAADRIEDDEAGENEVYRAWRELTALLDVESPETSTPGEFARAAVDAGLGREDVDELTRLFEDVRYGDREPSEAYEERAVAVFRRIERQYAEEEP